MFNKKVFLLSLFLIAIMAISVVSAEDSVDSIVVEDSNGDIDINDDLDNDVINSKSSSSILASSDDNGDSKIVSHNGTKDVEVSSTNSGNVEICESDDVSSEVVEDEIVIENKPKNTLKSSYDYYPYNYYIDPVNTYYVSGRYVYLGWEGYFDGYFKVYKGSSCVHSEYIYGFNRDLQWSTNNLGVGTYTAKLIDSTYGLLDSAKIVINKATSKISVKSFTTRAGTKFHCYAYVYDKNDGANINGGYVKFTINGKTYKAKLKNGVASFYFKVPKKAKKYTCKAYYPGGKNIKASSTKFTMKVKKAIKYKVVSVKTKWDKYVTKKWKKFKVQTYKFKSPSMSTLCIFLYKNGKMVSGYKYYSRYHYKYKGKWYWTKWRTSYGEATYHKTAGIKRSVQIGQVKVKFRI